MGPQVSEPRAIGTRPAATAAPEPVEEPPVKCTRFHGLRAGGHGRSNDGPAWAISWVASLPSRTAPASYSLAVGVAASEGVRSREMRGWAEGRMPAVA